MKLRNLAIAGVLSLSLTACENPDDTKLLTTLLGAAAGAAIGSQIGSGAGNAVAIGVGALIGGVAGNLIGNHLAEQDRQRAQQAARRSISSTPAGSSSTWRNPDTGNSGSYTPQGETFVNDKGQTCRKVRQTVIVDGKEQVDMVDICEQPDGDIVTG